MAAVKKRFAAAIALSGLLVAALYIFRPFGIAANGCASPYFAYRLENSRPETIGDLPACFRLGRFHHNKKGPDEKEGGYDVVTLENECDTLVLYRPAEKNTLLEGARDLADAPCAAPAFARGARLTLKCPPFGSCGVSGIGDGHRFELMVENRDSPFH